MSRPRPCLAEQPRGGETSPQEGCEESHRDGVRETEVTQLGIRRWGAGGLVNVVLPQRMGSPFLSAQESIFSIHRNLPKGEAPQEGELGRKYRLVLTPSPSQRGSERDLGTICMCNF